MDRVEIHPPTWKLALMVLGMVALVAGGIFMIIDGDSVSDYAVAIIGIVFFGGFCGYGLYARSRGQGKIAILPTGLEIGLPGVNPRLLPWSDIEGFDVCRIGNQEFTAVKLKSYQAWLSGISEQEATAAVRFFQSMGLLLDKTTRVARANDDDPVEMQQMLDGSREVRSLVDILAYNRAKFGAEFLLGWTMRDRGAQQFAEYLEQCRSGSH